MVESANCIQTQTRNKQSGLYGASGSMCSTEIEVIINDRICGCRSSYCCYSHSFTVLMNKYVENESFDINSLTLFSTLSIFSPLCQYRLTCRP